MLIVAVQNGVDRRELGVATSTTSFFRGLGGAIGAAAFGAVFTAHAGLHASAAGTGLHALDASGRTAVIGGVESVFLVAAPLAALALLVVVLLPEAPLRRTV
jgi:hypothetical protein